MTARLTLARRESSPVPIELEGVTPDRVEKLSLIAVARLPIYHGNRREELGEHFDTAGDPAAGAIHIRGDTSSVKGIGTALAAGSIVVDGDAGMHAGARMTGGSLTIDGRAGDWLGAEMRGGLIRVKGNVGDLVGAAYRGSRRGMTGGTILVHGNAGDEVGLLLRRGLIAVGGRCGEFAGASMIAGSLFVHGEAGGRLGAGMKRGTIGVGRVAELPPSFRLACRYRPAFLALFGERLRAMGFPVPISLLDVKCYRGDLLNGGRGEVLVTGH